MSIKTVTIINVLAFGVCCAAFSYWFISLIESVGGNMNGGDIAMHVTMLILFWSAGWLNLFQINNTLNKSRQ